MNAVERREAQRVRNFITDGGRLLLDKTRGTTRLYGVRPDDVPGSAFHTCPRVVRLLVQAGEVKLVHKLPPPPPPYVPERLEYLYTVAGQAVHAYQHEIWDYGWDDQGTQGLYRDGRNVEAQVWTVKAPTRDPRRVRRWYLEGSDKVERLHVTYVIDTPPRGVAVVRGDNLGEGGPCPNCGRGIGSEDDCAQCGRSATYAGDGAHG